MLDLFFDLITKPLQKLPDWAIFLFVLAFYSIPLLLAN